MPLHPQFLDWQNPVLAGALELLSQEVDWKSASVDMSHLAVIVPTGHSGRRLREALVLAAARANAALLPPLIVTPAAVLGWTNLDVGLEVAGSAASVAAWVSVLTSHGLEDWPDVFPVEPASQDFSWAMQVASEFQHLRKMLGEVGIGFAQAARRLGQEFPEAARWDQLGRLEVEYERVLAQNGLVDREQVRRQAAAKAQAPESIKHIYIMAVPDPLPLVCHALQGIADAGTMVTVAIHAPNSSSHQFDQWGRPQAAHWTACPLVVPDPDENISLVPRPEEEAAEIARRIFQPDKNRLSIGLADPEIIEPLKSALSGSGVSLFDPEGVPVGRHPVYWSLRVLSDLLGSRSYAAYCQLLRIPSFLDAMHHAARKQGVDHAANLCLAADNFFLLRLPASLDEALELVSHPQLDREYRPELLAFSLEKTNWLLRQFEELPFEDAVLSFLDFAWGSQELSSQSAESSSLAQLSDSLHEALREIVQASMILGSKLGAGHKLELLLRLLRDLCLYSEAGEMDIELLGWLELAWEDAPRLLLGGLNEGMVPESVIGDAWLPHGARAQLGLKTNDDRLARDSYLLCSLMESRKAVGRVEIFAAAASSSGDPLKPSRLLLRCPPDELPARVMRLFPKDGHQGTSIQQPPWERAWKLLPPACPADYAAADRLSVTQFGAYLACPFRFYLSQVLKMDRPDAQKQEMDALDFGNVCHLALEALARCEELRNVTKEDDLRSFLLGELDRIVRDRFGRVLSVPLLIQLEAAKARLGAAGAIHARERSAGWRPKHVEISLADLRGEKWLAEGVEIKGRIDVIERHEATGAWRLLDYKTSGEAKDPFAAHAKSLSRARSTRNLEGWEQFEVAGKPYRWTNLQLPLYAIAAREKLGENVSVGYFNLPRSLAKVEICEWKDLDAAMLGAAWECALGVVRKVRRGVFWPPADKVDFEEFGEIFFPTALESVDPSLLLAQPLEG